MAEYTLYHEPGSGFCVAVRLAAEAYGVKLKLVLLDLDKGEQLKPEFLKLNPQHTVPTLVDASGHFIVTESRAIIQYFANKYGSKKTESLYPSGPEKRALVDQRFYFDMGSLYKAFSEAYYPPLFEKGEFDEAKLKAVDTNLEYLELFLAKTKFAAGDTVTIADFNIAVTVAIMDTVKHKLDKFPKVRAYLETCKKEITAFKELNQEGLDLWAGLVKY